MAVHSLKILKIETVEIILLVCAFLNASALNIAHNTTVKLECRGREPYPYWLINETHARSPQYTVDVDHNTGDFIGKLVINGNETRGTLDLRCVVYRETTYSTTLTIQGPLPSPDNVTISSQNSSTQLQWKPPYYTLNNESNVIHVDPHITHYTVYTMDVSNDSMIDSVNVTDTSFTPTNILLCPIYRVSAWNAGSEGEMSEPVQESRPQAEKIDVRVTAESGTLQFRIEMDAMCTSRMPEFFIITLLTTDGHILHETTVTHQPEDTVARFPVRLPQSVDVCSLHVRISAGNSAGVSAPSDIAVTVCSGDSTESTTAASTTAGSTVTTVTSTGRWNNEQQGDSSILIAIVIGVIAVICGVLIVAATVGIMCYRKHKRNNPSEQTDNYYSKSPSLSGPVPLYKTPVTEAVYATSEEATSRADSESTQIQTQSSDFTESTDTVTTSSSEGSGHSSDLLLPPSAPATAGSPHLVYAQVDMKQTQVSPPACVEPVQYSSLAHKDKS